MPTPLRKRALRVEKANPGATYDPELLRQDILPRLAGASCPRLLKQPAVRRLPSDIRREKWAPHLSTWRAPAELPDRRRSKLGRFEPRWHGVEVPFNVEKHCASNGSLSGSASTS